MWWPLRRRSGSPSVLAMATERQVQRYRRAYAALLRLYPRRFRDQFAEGMAQSFNDLLREHTQAGNGCAGVGFRVFTDTLLWILKARLEAALQSRHIVRPAAGTCLLLMIPLVMTILDRDKAPGEGWAWGPFDFLVMGALLFSAGFGYELLSSRVTRRSHRVAAGMTITCLTVAIWAELAVDAVSQLWRHVLG